MKKKSTIPFEVYIWIGIIVITIANLFFPWYLAQNTLFYFLFFVLLACAILYIRSQRLYIESEQKSKELIQQQKEEKNSRKTIDLIFEHSEDGILALDPAQRIISFSPGMEKMTGYKKQEVLGLSAQEVLKFQGNKSNSLLPDLMFVQSGIKKHPYVKNTLTTKEGREINIEASYTLIFDSRTHLSTGIAIIRDTTYEEELIRRDKEFIAITSHQMNTPLSIIRGYVSLLRSGKAGRVTKEQKEYIDEIYTSVTKIISITNNLLSISRIEQEKIKLQKDDVSLSKLLSKLDECYSKIAKEKGINFSIDKIKEDTVFYADNDKLYQALSNIIDNALKYTKKGSVEIKARKNDKDLVIAISDTGIGIDDSELTNIGQKFYRTQSAIDIDNRGTGLGLFIAKTIIEKHDGKLEIKSTKDKGTTINIRIPLK